MKRVVFTFIVMLAPGLAQICHAQAWTYTQDSLITYCTSGSSSCTFAPGNILPTSPGTVWVVFINTANNVTISSVTGGGGTWTLCPASSCHLFNSTLGSNVDMAYNLSGNAGTTSVTVNLSGSAAGFFGGNFIEIQPPAGSVPAFDTAGTATSNSCQPCTAVGLNLSGGTDAVIQMLTANNITVWDAWSSPYMTDTQSDGINLAATSGTAPTVTVGRAGGALFTAIAFKSSAGTFTPPPAPISIVNFTDPNPLGINCNPSCSAAIPSTGSGHLLYVEAATLNGAHISSISGGGTWVIPAGANTCQVSLSNSGDALSCAYVLSSTAGSTSLNITMSGTSSTAFAIYEIQASGASFAFDTEGSTTNSATKSPSGQTLTLSGSNDAIFQAIFQPGGTSAVSLYPQPDSVDFFTNNAGQAVLLNTSSGAAPHWANEQNNATVVSGVAFKTSGTATPPAPPTSLTVVVH